MHSKILLKLEKFQNIILINIRHFMESNILDNIKYFNSLTFWSLDFSWIFIAYLYDTNRY